MRKIRTHSPPQYFSTLDMNDFYYIPASLWRRLTAIIYDGLLLFAVLMISSALTIPFTGGKGIEQHSPILTLYFLAVIFLFNAWFWTHGGQTLGMRAWRIRIVQRNGQPLCWKLAFVRFLLNLPFWGYLLLITLIASNKVNIPFDLDFIPVWLLYLIAIVWLVIDQLPDNWRDKVGKARVISTSEKK